MKKVTNGEMIKFLSASDKKYLYLINGIKKSELPIAAFKSECFIFENSDDFVLVFDFFDNSSIYNTILSDDSHIEEFYNIVMNKSGKEHYIYTQNKDLFNKEKFINLFGKFECSDIGSSNYIAFKFSDTGKEFESYKNHIRLLTPEDEQFVLSFDADKRTALKRSFDSYIVNKSYLGMIYGYFIDNELCAYLSADSADGRFWDVEYIYTLEKYRGQKIGTNLAAFYLNDIIGNGGASYGYAENDASAKVAVNAGFEKYDITYSIDWVKNSI